MNRRGFLKAVIGAGSAVIAAMLSAPAVGFLLSPLFTKQPVAWTKLAALDEIPYDIPTLFIAHLQTGSGWEARAVPRAVYAFRFRSGELKTFSNICTHMQCDVHWDKALGKFLCPCHGGMYDLHGTNIAGPPPAPLPEWRHRITHDASGKAVVEVSNQLNERI